MLSANVCCISRAYETNPVRPAQPWLSEKQLGLISEILGDKLDKSKFDLNANVN